MTKSEYPILEFDDNQYAKLKLSVEVGVVVKEFAMTL